MMPPRLVPDDDTEAAREIERGMSEGDRRVLENPNGEDPDEDPLPDFDWH